MRPVARRSLGLVVAVALATACGGQSAPPSEPDRLDLLGRAFAARDLDPKVAANLFREAGPGPVLETARLVAWLESLERIEARPDSWRAFLADRPPADLAARATLALGAALASEGDLAAAVATLEGAPEAARHRADLTLLDIGDPVAAGAAARRLARQAPQLLRERAPALERETLAVFNHDDWLARAAAWRAAGRGSRGAAELRGQRRRGDEERERRVELARCELDAGSTGRALAVLPPAAAANFEELTLRAEVERRRGWQRVPDRAAARSFAACAELASRALARPAAGPPEAALTLIVECGTEAGELRSALDAWWRLEASGWRDDRRGWLGRRLGVALARAGAEADAIADLAFSLPEHERCLSFWQAADRDRVAVERLAGAAVADLYGRWARADTTTSPKPGRFEPAPDLETPSPPASVAWLLANGGPDEALREWQRLLDGRRPSRPEALAAAELATRTGRHNTAIRILRTGFPELASTSIAGAPGNVTAAYLPLRWPEHLLAAAAETGLDPWLIAAVARQESVFTAHARSPAGALGVLQLLPGTARQHARALGLGSRPDLGDPAVNIRIGAHELASLVGRFGGLEPALAAYNAGERRVRGWWRRWPDARVFTESVPIPETYNYIRRVVFLADAYRLVHADVWRSPT